MATYRLSPQERATMYARKVDRLFVRNRDYFLSHVETFKQEEAGRKKREREKDAEQSHFIEIEAWRPGPDPTPATMVTLLAALHDECLPDSPSILDPASNDPLRAARDLGLLALWGARVWCIEARAEKQGDTDRLDALETYLSRARADIEAAAQLADLKAAGAERARQEREEKTGAGKRLVKRFQPGKRSKAWQELRRIVRAAAQHVWIEDTWLDSDVVGLLGEDLPDGVQLRVLGPEDRNRSWNGALASLKRLCKDLPGRIEVRVTTDLHDRYVYVDNHVWRFSESPKDMGAKRTAKIIDEGDRSGELVADFEKRWSSAR